MGLNHAGIPLLATFLKNLMRTTQTSLVKLLFFIQARDVSRLGAHRDNNLSVIQISLLTDVEENTDFQRLSQLKTFRLLSCSPFGESERGPLGSVLRSVDDNETPRINTCAFRKSTTSKYSLLVLSKHFAERERRYVAA